MLLRLQQKGNDTKVVDSSLQLLTFFFLFREFCSTLKQSRELWSIVVTFSHRTQDKKMLEPTSVEKSGIPENNTNVESVRNPIK